MAHTVVFSTNFMCLNYGEFICQWIVSVQWNFIRISVCGLFASMMKSTFDTNQSTNTPDFILNVRGTYLIIICKNVGNIYWLICFHIKGENTFVSMSTRVSASSCRCNISMWYWIDCRFEFTTMHCNLFRNEQLHHENCIVIYCCWITVVSLMPIAYVYICKTMPLTSNNISDNVTNKYPYLQIFVLIDNSIVRVQ